MQEERQGAKRRSRDDEERCFGREHRVDEVDAESTDDEERCSRREHRVDEVDADKHGNLEA